MICLGATFQKPLKRFSQRQITVWQFNLVHRPKLINATWTWATQAARCLHSKLVSPKYSDSSSISNSSSNCFVRASIFLSASLGPFCRGGVTLNGNRGFSMEWAVPPPPVPAIVTDEATVPAKIDPLWLLAMAELTAEDWDLPECLISSRFRPVRGVEVVGRWERPAEKRLHLYLALKVILTSHYSASVSFM